MTKGCVLEFNASNKTKRKGTYFAHTFEGAEDGISLEQIEGQAGWKGTVTHEKAREKERGGEREERREKEWGGVGENRCVSLGRDRILHACAYLTIIRS